MYKAHLQQIADLRNDVEELKEQIQNAASRHDRDLPPIPEDEDDSYNPRRIRPRRDHLRENSRILASEVAIAYEILNNGGKYHRNTTEIAELEKENSDLRNYLILIGG